MQVAPVAFAIWAGLVILGYVLRAPLIVSLFGSLAFGSTAVATLPALGGSSVLLFAPIAGIMIASSFRPGSWRYLQIVIVGHWHPIALFILALSVIAGALILPRLFAGETTVFVPFDGRVVERPLAAVWGNLNQVCYFVTGILAYFAVAIELLRHMTLRPIKLGMFAFVALNALLGTIDLLGKVAGVGDALEPIRTAGYSMLIEVQVEGFWRIAGGYPEASTFGAASLVAIGFTFSYWRATGSKSTLILCLLSIALLLLSTSTTAYSGFCVLVALLVLSLLVRGATNRLLRRDLGIVASGVFLLAMLTAIAVMNQKALDPAVKLIEATIINKADSDSAAERFYWNRKSWAAFGDTHGLGVGLGSSRASSSLWAVPSQLGVIGTVLVVLLASEFVRPPLPRVVRREDSEVAALCLSLRTAGFAGLVPAAIAGGGADPGILFFILLASLVVGKQLLAGQSAVSREILDSGNGCGAPVAARTTGPRGGRGTAFPLGREV
jgi:hypothetical protein